MPTNTSTPAHLDAGTVAAYLDMRLPPAQAASVEAHLADCATCRAEMVALDRIVRPRRSARRVVLASIGVAVAAAALLYVLPKDAGLSGGPEDPARAGSVALRIRALGAVAQPPIYLGVSVRAPSPRGTELFATGMRAYTDGRFADAVPALRGAREAGVEGPATPFFLGASLLMVGDASGAAEEFARVVGMGETPYLAEAHYYRAKALLRLDQPGEAVAELERAIRAGVDPVTSTAQSLRDSLRVLRAR